MWYTYQYSGSKNSKLTITPSLATDIYISKDSSSDPNNFEHDISFLGVTGKTTILTDDLGLTNDNGYAVAIYVAAVDEGANELLDATVDISFHEKDSAETLSLFSSMTTMAAIQMLAIF